MNYRLLVYGMTDVGWHLLTYVYGARLVSWQEMYISHSTCDGKSDGVGPDLQLRWTHFGGIYFVDISS